MIRTKTKPDSLGTLIKKLDTVFAQFIKLRDADPGGTVRCFVTGERIYYTDCDAAHLFVRQHMATRWDELNVHAVSVDSNRFEAGHLAQYEARFKAKYGQESYEFLERKSRSMIKWTRAELEQMIEEYTQKVKYIRKQKGL